MKLTIVTCHKPFLTFADTVETACIAEIGIDAFNFKGIVPQVDSTTL